MERIPVGRQTSSDEPASDSATQVTQWCAPATQTSPAPISPKQSAGNKILNRAASVVTDQLVIDMTQDSTHNIKLNPVLLKDGTQYTPPRVSSSECERMTLSKMKSSEGRAQFTYYLSVRLFNWLPVLLVPQVLFTYHSVPLYMDVISNRPFVIVSKEEKVTGIFCAQSGKMAFLFICFWILIRYPPLEPE